MPSAMLKNVNSKDNVILYDGFDYPLNSYDGVTAQNAALGWQADTASGGTPPTLARNTTYKYAGTGCLGITSPATAFITSRASKRVPIPPSRVVGVEFYTAYQTYSLNMQDLSIGIDEISTPLKRWDYYQVGISSYYDGLQHINFSGATIQLMGFGVYDNMQFYASPFTDRVSWHHMKAVVDLNKREYVSVMVDDTVKNMAGISCYKGRHTSFGVPYNVQDELIIYLRTSNANLSASVLTLFDEVLVTDEG